MCGGLHFIRECKHVDEYVANGKCKRNSEEKVVLPNGLFVPRSVPGKVLKDRIDEYHCRNLISPSTNTLLHTINNQHTYQAPEEPTFESIIKAAYQLSKQEIIATLEAELFNLRVKKPALTSAIQTRAQRAKAPDVADVGEDIVLNKAKTTSRIEEIVDEEIPTQETLAPAEQLTILPEHPYRNARDAAYVPPTTQNVGIQAKAPAIPRRSEPAYKTLPPIHDPAITNNVYNRSMNAPITLTQQRIAFLVSGSLFSSQGQHHYSTTSQQRYNYFSELI
jgi:hypothetical protein